MEKEKFELDLRMTETGIVCNAQTLKDMLPKKLKSYSYVVTENNYSDAKEDRTKLNNLYKVVQEKRKQFNDIEMAEWIKQKAIIMDMEKMIKEVSDALGKGISDVDDKENIAKMKEIEGLYDNIAQSLPLDIPFEKFYVRKTYDAKKWTIKKIIEDMQVKIDDAVTKWKLLEAYLPDDAADLEQVKQVYIETLDSSIAKAKADDLKAIRDRIKKQQIKTHSEQKQAVEQAKTSAVETTVMNTDKKQRVVAEFIAVRAFYDEMNQLVKKYNVSVKVLEREDK